MIEIIAKFTNFDNVLTWSKFVNFAMILGKFQFLLIAHCPKMEETA